jgi:S1-C subfamily serine protease
MKKLILILISIFIFTSHSFGAEEKARSDIYSYGKVDAKEGGKITTRGSGGKIEKITPRKYIKIFKSNLEKRSKLKKYTKLLSTSLTKQPKRIQTRGSGGPIYNKFAKTVVYIGNYENEGVGSGFLIDTPGIILTNWHVIDKADEVAVWLLPNGPIPSEKKLIKDIVPLIGSIIATNKKEDLAIIKVGNFPKNINPVNVGSLREVNIGDKVYAIGHPGGLPWTFSEGIINQIREKKVWDYPGSEYEHVATLIQTQTPINPGNSGGPLFSENGNLIGINTLKGPGENINFAVAVEHAVKFLNDNPQIKNMNPSELIMKKNYPKARTQDYNENGVVDTWYIDSNNNGIEDRALVDDDEDGFIEAVLYDENENGVWEAQYVDDDLDGKANRLVLDQNEDKKPDVVGYDDDQDGKWDRFEEIS